jgi:integrase/recombinase XerD
VNLPPDLAHHQMLARVVSQSVATSNDVPIGKGDTEVGPTFEQAIDDWILWLTSRGRSVETLKSYQADMRRFRPFCAEHGLVELASVRPRDLWAFFAQLQSTTKNESHPLKPAGGKLSGFYLHRIYRTLRAFFNFCERMEMIQINPMRKVDPPVKEKRVIPHLRTEEIEALLEATNHGMTAFLRLRDRAIVLAFLDSIMRVSELCSLTIEGLRVTKHGGAATIIGKGQKERTVFFSEASWPAIQEYLKYHPFGCGALFVTQHFNPLTRCGMEQLVERLAQRAGLKRRVWPHLFRHTAATRFLRNGGNQRALQQIGGWSDAAIVAVYVTFTEDELEDLHAQCTPVARL